MRRATDADRMSFQRDVNRLEENNMCLNSMQKRLEGYLSNQQSQRNTQLGWSASRAASPSKAGRFSEIVMDSRPRAMCICKSSTCRLCRPGLDYRDNSPSRSLYRDRVEALQQRIDECKDQNRSFRRGTSPRRNSVRRRSVSVRSTSRRSSPCRTCPVGSTRVIETRRSSICRSNGQ